MAANPMFLIELPLIIPWNLFFLTLNPMTNDPIGHEHHGPKTPLFMGPGGCSSNRSTLDLDQTESKLRQRTLEDKAVSFVCWI